MNFSPSSECDLSVVAVAQGEGLLLHRTLRSIQAAIIEAMEVGLSAEVIVVLDTPTDETKSLVARCPARCRVLQVAFEDEGASRNWAVEHARGKYVSFVGGADLVSSRWLRSAYQRATECSLADFAVHPKVTLEWGQRVNYYEHVASTHPRIQLAELAHRSYWTSTFLAPRNTLLRLPFALGGNESGFDYADWHWYCNLLTAGGEVLVAPETCLLVRATKPECKRSFSGKPTGLIQPTKLLEPRTFSERARLRSTPAVQTDMPGSANSANESSLSKLKGWARSAPSRISKLTESYPPLQKSLGYIYRKVVGPSDPRGRLPHWLLAAWESLAMIDPSIFPDTESLTYLEIVSPASTPEAHVFADVCQRLADENRNDSEPQFTHVYLLPWLKRGGAEHVAIHYIQMAASCSSNRVLVVLTDGSDAPWKERLPTSVEVLDYWGASQQLRPDARQRLLVQLLVQLKPHVIHLVNSQLGSRIFTRFGRALSQVARLYAPAFCADVSPEGKLMSYVVTYLPKYDTHLTAIHSDNQSILNYLEKTFAFDPAKMFVHYQPVQIKEVARRGERSSAETLQVLWAGRLDRQKRPDLLLAIARECRPYKMHFHVYGSSQLPWEQAMVDFEGATNVTYHGPFDGLPSLPTEAYDVFLNTSQWDGMPNILLEAAGLGLPIVSSNVGGIGELIQPDETGLLVTPFEDVAQYVAALHRYQDDVNLRERMRANCQRLVAERHSWAHFAADIDRFPGYCDQPIQLANVFKGPVRKSDTLASLKPGQPV